MIFLESIGFSLTFVEFDKTLVWYLSEEKVYFIFYFIEGIFYASQNPLIVNSIFNKAKTEWYQNFLSLF
jgi:hypothetical protein